MATTTGKINVVSIILRVVRGAVTVAIGGWVVGVTNNPKYIWLAPVILALSKALRDKFPGKFDWLPV